MEASIQSSRQHTAVHHALVMRHALVINHPSERERLGAAQRLCADLRLNCRRIRPPALEHASVTRCVARGRANCSVAHERERQCQAMTPKECSILLAHAMAWRALGRARPAAAALVLEDDAVRSAAVSPSRLRAMIRSEPSAPIAQLGLCLPTWCFEHQHCACVAAEVTQGRGGKRRGGDGVGRGGGGSGGGGGDDGGVGDGGGGGGGGDGGGGGVACRGLCAHAYRLTPAGAQRMLSALARSPHAKVDLLFPHAPMLGGLDPCVIRGGGVSGSGVGVEGVSTSGVAMEGDVGAICQNRSLPPMHDPALL